MAEYQVTWIIEIEANTPREAAQQALAIQRKVGSSAVVFEVTDIDSETTRVDLDEVEDQDA